MNDKRRQGLAKPDTAFIGATTGATDPQSSGCGTALQRVSGNLSDRVRSPARPSSLEGSPHGPPHGPPKVQQQPSTESTTNAELDGLDEQLATLRGRELGDDGPLVHKLWLCGQAVLVRRRTLTILTQSPAK